MRRSGRIHWPSTDVCQQAQTFATEIQKTLSRRYRAYQDSYYDVGLISSKYKKQFILHLVTDINISNVDFILLLVSSKYKKQFIHPATDINISIQISNVNFILFLKYKKKHFIRSSILHPRNLQPKYHQTCPSSLHHHHPTLARHHLSL